MYINIEIYDFFNLVIIILSSYFIFEFYFQSFFNQIYLTIFIII